MKSYFSIQNKKKENEKTKLDFESHMESMQKHEKSKIEIMKTEKILKDLNEEIFKYPSSQAHEETKKYVQDTSDPFLVKKISKNLFFQKSVLEDKSFDENAKIPKQL